MVPEWDWLTIYEGGKLTLANVPDAPWFNSKDPHAAFVFTDVVVLNRTRSTRYINTEPGRLDFELSGVSDGVVFMGSYLGIPAVIDDNPVTAGDQLGSALLKISEERSCDRRR